MIDVKGDQVKLGVKAPRSLSVHRGEIYQEIQEQNEKGCKFWFFRCFGKNRKTLSSEKIGILIGNFMAKKDSKKSLWYFPLLLFF